MVVSKKDTGRKINDEDVRHMHPCFATAVLNTRGSFMLGVSKQVGGKKLSVRFLFRVVMPRY